MTVAFWFGWESCESVMYTCEFCGKVGGTSCMFLGL